MMLRTWNFTVVSDRYSCAAMPRLLRPFATSRAEAVYKATKNGLDLTST
jgi:hypothetical protein